MGIKLFFFGVFFLYYIFSLKSMYTFFLFEFFVWVESCSEILIMCSLKKTVRFLKVVIIFKGNFWVLRVDINNVNSFTFVCFFDADFKSTLFFVESFFTHYYQKELNCIVFLKHSIYTCLNFKANKLFHLTVKTKCWAHPHQFIKKKRRMFIFNCLFFY